VLSPACHLRYGVRVSRLFESRSADVVNGWQQTVMADRKVPVPDLAAFRIDFARWLQTLTLRDREIICAFSSGENTKLVAERFGLSEGRVSQLRRKFERLWQIFQGEAYAAA
jgi:hypothetical protein